MVQLRLDAAGPVHKYRKRTRIFVSYGRYVHVTELDFHLREIGMTQAEATVSGWVEFVPSEEQQDDDGRYAPLVGWLDGKWDGPLFSSRSAPVLYLEADVRALVAPVETPDLSDQGE